MTKEKQLHDRNQFPTHRVCPVIEALCVLVIVAALGMTRVVRESNRWGQK